jgi:serine/threonine protein kinase
VTVKYSQFFVLVKGTGMTEPRDRNNDRPDEQEAVPTADYGGTALGPGAQIGPYKLISILGEGGYGIVYLAEQQRPVKRRVALKVIKPGMDSKQVIARFEAERQALALLDHPNIAHVFNAGTTEAGLCHLPRYLSLPIP